MNEQDYQAQIEQMVQAWNRLVAAVQECVRRALKALEPTIKALQRLGVLPPPVKRSRGPKRRSRLRRKVALKRKGLWNRSVWA